MRDCSGPYNFIYSLYACRYFNRKHRCFCCCFFLILNSLKQQKLPIHEIKRTLLCWKWILRHVLRKRVPTRHLRALHITQLCVCVSAHARTQHQSGAGGSLGHRPSSAVRYPGGVLGESFLHQCCASKIRCFNAGSIIKLLLWKCYVSNLKWQIRRRYKDKCRHSHP